MDPNVENVDERVMKDLQVPVAGELRTLFFFSSRRRHTRLQGDWSSDVCSSDLDAEHVRRARQVQRMLARNHQRGRKLPDLLIAAAAEAHSLPVLHYDADFERIAADRKSVV